MEQRGRKSTAALTVVGSSQIEAINRPPPDPSLTKEQADEWREVVNRLPADWFPRETHGMLAAYCRHVAAGRRIAMLIEDIEDGEDLDLDAYDRLLKMQEREGRAMSSLATRMRISQQATVNAKKVKPMRSARKPWEAGKS